MTSAILKMDVSAGVARLTLNRPDKRNAINADLVGALASALERTSIDGAVRVVAILGAGKDFCAGADLAEVAEIAERGYEANVADAMTLGANGSQLSFGLGLATLLCFDHGGANLVHP